MKRAEREARKEAAEAGLSAITYIRAIERTMGLDGPVTDNWRADMAAQLAVLAFRAARDAAAYRAGTLS